MSVKEENREMGEQKENNDINRVHKRGKQMS